MNTAREKMLRLLNTEWIFHPDPKPNHGWICFYGWWEPIPRNADLPKGMCAFTPLCPFYSRYSTKIVMSVPGGGMAEGITEQGKHTWVFIPEEKEVK